MDHKAPERVPLPFSSFTTMRGKKGYPAEEVEEYCGTVNMEYGNLESEYRKLESELGELAVELSREQDERRVAEAKSDELSAQAEARQTLYDELNARYDALLAESVNPTGLSALEHEEYLQCKAELEQQAVTLQEQTQEIERLRTANEDFWKRILELEDTCNDRADQGAQMRESQNRASLVENERDILVVRLAAAEQEKKEFEEGIRKMNESMARGQDMLRTELRELRQQLEEKEGEIRRLKDAQAEVQSMSGEVVETGELRIQQEGVPAGFATKYIDILEVVRAAADSYAFETEKKMNELLSEAEQTAQQKVMDANAKAKETVSTAREEAEELLRESQLDAENLTQEAQARLESARKRGDEIVRVAEERAAEVLEKAKREHGQIRALIKSSSAEYQELSEQKASASETDLF
jgi:hypothetical protein